MTMQINAMNESHLDAAFGLTQRLSWPHRREDWRQALQLGEGVVAEQDGVLLGTTLFWRWGSDAATVGLVIVADEAQGKGIGKALMQAALAKLEGYQVRLHATEAGRVLYQKLGFAGVGAVAQHQCRALERVTPLLPGGGQRRRPACPDDAPALIRLDARAHGQQRDRLIRLLLDDAALRIEVLEEQGTATGFACLRRFGHGYAVGPIICQDLTRAKLLISALLAELSGEFVRIDTDAASGLGEWLTTLGLIEVDRPVTMIRGVPWQPQEMQAFGLMSQAMA
ncbi:GNAT family N-acetyltransferase [Erwinia sp. HDF1-3R]|uniref:GNAT family N-acetyltransferase n=1 Tax=Erwinia sp. HDF1-3R TaxID=3141543 RepID=UPI0031F5CE98